MAVARRGGKAAAFLNLSSPRTHPWFEVTLRKRFENRRLRWRLREGAAATPQFIKS